MLDEEDEFKGREIAVLAAGGIVGGKGVAAALALGRRFISMAMKPFVGIIVQLLMVVSRCGWCRHGHKGECIGYFAVAAA